MICLPFMKLPEKLLESTFFDYKKYLVDYILDAKKIKDVEIEARLGKIMSKDWNNRIYISTPMPIIYKSLPDEYYFKSGVSNKDFEDLKKIFSDMEVNEENDIILIKSGVREIYDISGKLKRVQKKSKKSSLTIYFPNCEYDLRISVSVETELLKEAIDRPVIIKRVRKRDCYVYDSFEFDFTEVGIRGKQAEESEHVFEVETEAVLYGNFNSTSFIEVVNNLNIPRKICKRI